MAFAALNKFAEAVQRNAEASLPQDESDPIDESTAVGKLQALAKKRNATAFASLMMAFMSERLLGLLTKAKMRE